MQELVAEKERKIIQKHVSQNGKIIEFHCENNGFDGFEGCMCERERYQKQSRMKSKSITKSMKHLCKSHARKSDAKMMDK